MASLRQSDILVLTIFLFMIIVLSFCYEGRFMRRLGVEQDAAPADAGRRTLRTREVLGSRPGPLRGSAFDGWTRNGRRRAKACPGRSFQASAVPGSTARSQKSPRWRAERRCAIGSFVADGGADRDTHHPCANRRAATPHREGRITQSSGANAPRDCRGTCDEISRRAV